MDKVVQDQAIYWLDSFTIPATSRTTFASKLSEIYDLVNGLAGCRRREILERVSGDGSVNVVILVEWESAGAMEDARETLAGWRLETGFSPTAFSKSLGVKAEFSQYSVLDRLA